MKILIAEDDLFFRRMLEQLLLPDYQLQVAEDGESAWAALQQSDAPKMAILDWVMPVMSGPQVCRKVRSNPGTASTYIILLTAKNSIADIVSGLRAGADDYITKPFDAEELRARVRGGKRILESQSALATQVAALEDALAREKSLQHLLPICPSCKGPRSDVQYWHEVETYLTAHTETEKYRGICPHCSNRKPNESFQLTEAPMESSQ